MPIQRELNIAFVHIPKTGGTTIEEILGLYEPWPAVRMDILRGPYSRGGEQIHLQHLPLDELSSISGLSFTNWFKFTFVRNPWDRLVSTFCFKHRKETHDRESFASFVEWAGAVVASKDQLASNNCHLRPQIDFLKDDLDFVGRFESFEKDLKKVLSEIGISANEFPHAHKSNRRHYAHYYDDRIKRRVAQIYSEDIEVLDYQF